MKKSMLIISMLCAASAAWATLVTDEFERPDQDTNGSADTSLIGPSWKQNPASVDRWFILGGQLRNKGVDALNIIYNDELAMASGGGDSFVYSAYVSSKASLARVGIVFNYQDDDNFYALRLQSDSTSFQAIKYVGGALSLMNGNSNVSAASNFVEDAYYRLIVTSDTAYEYNYTVLSGATTVLTGTITDVGGNHTGGHAGYYAGAASWSAGFDNYSLEVIPEPATLGMMGLVGVGGLFIRKRFMI